VIPYLVRKYVALVLVLAVLMMPFPIIVGTSVPVVVAQAFFWSGLATAPLTYWEFRRRNLGPLYDNLRLPKWILLALLVGTVEGLVLLAFLILITIIN